MALSGIFPSHESQAELDNTYASLTAANFPGGALGDVVIDNKGGQWMLVKAAENITAYSLCHITNASLQDGTYLAEMTEAADIATGPKVLGLCLNAITATTNPYFWLFRGPGGGYGSGVKVRAENATAGALLYPLSGTAGAVDDANVDEGVIAGLQTLTTTTTITAVEVYATTILTCNLTETD
jgi:hypothetical protein